VLRADVVYLPRHNTSLGGDATPRIGLRWAGSALHQHFLRAAAAKRGVAPAAVPRNVVLFITRQPGRKRSLTNEPLLLRRLYSELRGEFELVRVADPPDEDFEVVAMLAARAVVLIGPHGGGFMVSAVPLWFYNTHSARHEQRSAVIRHASSCTSRVCFWCCRTVFAAVARPLLLVCLSLRRTQCSCGPTARPTSSRS
jgi:hypothetical protein